MTVIMGVTIRLFHYVILAVYISCYRSQFTYAGSSVLYVLPTDYSSNNVSCPQNDCHTLNEWIESDFNLELITNEVDTIVLLPGVHIVNTTRANLSIEDIGSLVITSDGEASVWCISRFIFDFFSVEQVEISNIMFKLCERLIFSSINNIEVGNVIIEGENGISIEKTHSKLYSHVLNNKIFLYNLNITSKSNGMGIFYDSPMCDHNLPGTMYCTLLGSTQLYLQNCTLYMANIYLRAYCTQVNVQQITISHLRLDSFSVINGNAFAIYRAAKVSLKDIIIKDSTTPFSLLKISLCCMIELKGYILFQSNKNSGYIADFSFIEHSIKFFPLEK